MGSEDPCVLWISALHPRTTTDALRAAFDQFGPVVEAEVLVDPLTRRSRCVGVVRYDSAAKASEVLHECSEAALFNLPTGPRPVVVSARSPPEVFSAAAANAALCGEEGDGDGGGGGGGGQPALVRVAPEDELARLLAQHQAERDLLARRQHDERLELHRKHDQVRAAESAKLDFCRKVLDGEPTGGRRPRANGKAELL